MTTLEIGRVQGLNMCCLRGECNCSHDAVVGFSPVVLTSLSSGTSGTPAHIYTNAQMGVCKGVVEIQVVVLLRSNIFFNSPQISECPEMLKYSLSWLVIDYLSIILKFLNLILISHIWLMLIWILIFFELSFWTFKTIVFRIWQFLY